MPLAAAVREGGALALGRFRTDFKRWFKNNASPVSEVDIAVDLLLRERLMAAAPDCGWLSEESVDDPARLKEPRVWVVDPIDGTRAFLDHRADWAVSAALVEDGRPVLAALFAPVTDSLFLAIKDGGATCNGSLLAATSEDALDRVRIGGPRRRAAAIERLSQQPNIVENVRSLALRIARVADGSLDIAFAGPDSHDWDLAAADLLVHEAGGALTSLGGESVVYNRPEPVHGALVAAGIARHARLLELMRGRTAEFA